MGCREPVKDLRTCVRHRLRSTCAREAAPKVFQEKLHVVKTLSVSHLDREDRSVATCALWSSPLVPDTIGAQSVEDAELGFTCVPAPLPAAYGETGESISN